METKRYKPKFGKITYVIWVPTMLLLLGATVLAAFEPAALFIMIPTNLFTLYFFITPFVGYVELREHTIFIKFGFVLTKEIEYKSIRTVEMARKFYSDSMVSLKNTLDHVNIKYNRFDVISVSVVENDELITDIKTRLQN